MPKPSNLDTMIDICRKLSEDFDFVRVDLYSIHDQVFFGELTHYPAAGFGKFNPPAFDLEMGSYWNVSAQSGAQSRKWWSFMRKLPGQRHAAGG